MGSWRKRSFNPHTLTNLYARSAIKNLRGEYYLNGHWVIEFSRATPIAGTTLYYQRGAEGDNVPESITGRGPTTEPLVVEVGGNVLFQQLYSDLWLMRRTGVKQMEAWL